MYRKPINLDWVWLGCYTASVISDLYCSTVSDLIENISFTQGIFIVFVGIWKLGRNESPKNQR